MLSKIFRDTAESQLASALSVLEREFRDRLAKACEEEDPGDMASEIRYSALFAIEDRASRICEICVAVLASIPGELSADILEFARGRFLGEYQKVNIAAARARAKIVDKRGMEPLDLGEYLNDGMALLTRELGAATEKTRVEPPAVPVQDQHSPEIFLVHGHDHGLLEQVARFLERLGQSVHILHEKPNEGKTLIEKFEQYADRAGFAVVLLTPDDRGGQAHMDPVSYRSRARQNVIFELGYFVGLLGRHRVCAVYLPEVELPSDYHGVAYVPFTKDGGWRLGLARELKAAHLSIDLNLAF
jgi:predicted nucleotide-binding protein